MVFQATSLSDLDSEILDNLPLDIRDKIMAGEIDKIPDNYIRKQTLTNALKEMKQKPEK